MRVRPPGAAQPISRRRRRPAIRSPSKTGCWPCAGSNAALLRPLLVLGMLAATFLVWTNATFGWSYTADHLAPGERMVDAIHDLNFEYRIDQRARRACSPSWSPASATANGASCRCSRRCRTMSATPSMRAARAPGLIVQTVNGELLLARPGQVTPVSAIGLGFPSAGSEETLLLPQQAAGLRMVRTESRGTPGPRRMASWSRSSRAAASRPCCARKITAAEIVSIPTPPEKCRWPSRRCPTSRSRCSAARCNGCCGWRWRWRLWAAWAFGSSRALSWRRSAPGRRNGPSSPCKAICRRDGVDQTRWYSESTQDGVKE